MTSVDEVFARRRRFWANGFRPLEVWSPRQRCNDKGEPLNNPGKQPRGLWREDASRDPPAAAERSPDQRALNTGILCGSVVAFDVDVLDQQLVDWIVHLIETNVGLTPLVRIGRAPKILLVYRADRPFGKLQTPELFFPGGTKAQVELLAEGQQFVADGIHPDTGAPYAWTTSSPTEARVDELPVVSEEQARQIMAEAERLLRAAGGREKEKPQPIPQRGANGASGGFFGQINTAALGDLSSWVRAIFPRARFEPGTGAWRVSSKDLGRDLEEDISIHPSGIRDFGAEMSLTALDLVMQHNGQATVTEAALWLCDRLRIDPVSLGYVDPASRVHAKPNGLETDTPGRVSLSDFYAYMPAHNYIFVPTREPWPASSVNSRIPPFCLLDAAGNPVLDKDQKPIKLTASGWLDQNRPVEQMTWAPGEPVVIPDRLISHGGWIERQGVHTFNLYRPPIVEPGDPAAVGRWLEHLCNVYPDDADHISKWLAHRVQRPQDKINHALVLGGKMGIGKDTILEPVKVAVGRWNFEEVSPAQILGRFNGFIKSVILRMSEARDLGDVNRYQLYDHLKALIAAPPDVLRCDEKYLREHSVLNCCGVIITTNHKTDGIYLPQDDRRHYVAWSDRDIADFSDAYWRNLYDWFEDGGAEHVCAYLRSFDISAFNPKSPPPKTQAFWEIVSASRAPEDAELEDAIEMLGKPDIVTVSRAISCSPKNFAEWLSDRKNSKRIPHRFEACGYVAVPNEDRQDSLWIIDGKRQIAYGKAALTVRERIAAAQRVSGAR